MAIGSSLLTLPWLRGHDLHGHVRLDLRVQPDGDAMGACVLDGGVEVDTAPIDAGPARLRDRVDDLRCGDRAEQPAFLAGLGWDHDPERLEMGGHGPGLLEIGDLSGDASGADALGLAHRARRGEPREVAGQQVVAPVAVGDLYDVARGTDAPDLLVEDDLHVVDLALADGVWKQRHLSGVLDRRRDVALVLGAVPRDPPGADLAAVAHELPQQVNVLVVDVVLLVSAELAELALGLALERALWHSLCRLLAGARRALRPCRVSERRLVAELAAAAARGRRVVAATAAATAVGGTLHLGGGELQARADLVGLDLGHRALLALGRLPGAHAQPAHDHHPHALLQGVGDVRSLLAPDVDAEERRVAVPPGVAVAHPGSHGEPDVGHRDAVGRELQLGIGGQVADEHDLVVTCHLYTSLTSRAGHGRARPAWTRPRKGLAGKENVVGCRLRRRPPAGRSCAGSRCRPGRAHGRTRPPSRSRPRS